MIVNQPNTLTTMSNNVNQLRRVMSRANYLYRSNIILLRGANLSRREKQKVSLKLAWYFEHFRNMLATGVFRFSYFKKEGGIREANGTLCDKFIPFKAQPKGVYEAGNDDPRRFNYYDIDALWWRSFYIDQFIGFVEPVA